MVKLDRETLEIEVFLDPEAGENALPDMWLSPYDLGDDVGKDEEVVEPPEWVLDEAGEDDLLYLVPISLLPELQKMGFKVANAWSVWGEVCPICGGVLSPSAAWANYPWTHRPSLGHQKGCRRKKAPQGKGSRT